MAAPVFRSAGTAVEGNSVSAVTVNYTLTAGDDLFVLIEAGAPSTPSITSVNWNTSEALTLVGSANQSTFRNTFLYRLAGGTSGSHSVVITASISCNVLAAVAFGYTPAGGLGTVGTGTGLSTTPSVTASGSSGGTILGVGQAAADFTSFTPNGATTQDNEQTTTDVSFFIVHGADAASVTLGGTLGASDPWAWLALRLAPAAAATQDIPVTNANLVWDREHTYSDGAGAFSTSTGVRASSTKAGRVFPGILFRTQVTVAAGGAGTCSLVLDTTGLNGLTAADCPQLAVLVDGALSFYLTAYSATDVVQSLGTLGASATHTVEVWSDSQGPAQPFWDATKVPLVKALRIDADASVAAPTVPASVLMWDGDSYSMGLLSAGGTDANANNSVLNSQARYAARALGYDLSIRGGGGQGYTRGMGNVVASSTNPGFVTGTSATQSYDKIAAGQNNLSGGLLPTAPAVWVIAYGRNDSGLTSGNVSAAVAACRAIAGSSCKILLLLDHFRSNATAISAGQAAAADPNCKLLDFGSTLFTSGTTNIEDSYDGSHPSVVGQAKRGAVVAKLIQQALGGGAVRPLRSSAIGRAVA